MEKHGKSWKIHGKIRGKSIGKSIGIEKIHGKPVAKLVFLLKPRNKFWMFSFFLVNCFPSMLEITPSELT